MVSVFIVSSFLFVFLWKTKVSGVSKISVFAAFGIKLLFAAAFVIFHFQKIDASTIDAQYFMKESKILNDIYFQNPSAFFSFLSGTENTYLTEKYLSKTNHWSAGDMMLFRDSQHIIRFNALIHFFSQSNIWIHLLIFNFLSFLGFRELYLALKNQTEFSNRFLWFGLFLIPSIGFWTSGILKETPLIIGLCLLIRALLDSSLNSTKRGVLSFVGLVLLISFKFYVLIALFIGFTSILLVKKIFNKYILFYSLTLLFVFGIASSLIPFGKIRPIDYLSRKQFDFLNVANPGIHLNNEGKFYFFKESQMSNIKKTSKDSAIVISAMKARVMKHGQYYPFHFENVAPQKKNWLIYYETKGSNSSIPLPMIENNWIQLFKGIPRAIWNASYRPFFEAKGGKLGIINTIESIFLFFLLFYFWGRNRQLKSKHNETYRFVFFQASIILLTLIGFITPVLGAIVRYRVPVFLLLIVCTILSHQIQHKSNES